MARKRRSTSVSSSGTRPSAPGGSWDVRVRVWGYDDERREAEDLVAEVVRADAFTVDANQPPSVAFEWSPSTPEVGTAVTFSASGAGDPGGSIAAALFLEWALWILGWTVFLGCAYTAWVWWRGHRECVFSGSLRGLMGSSD